MYLFFDTETTGLPKNYNAPISDFNNWPRLVQIAYLMFDEKGDKILEKNYIIKPEGFEIPLQATKLHGISTQQAMLNGTDLTTVLTDFQSLINQSSHLVAHNINFDEKIIGAEFLRKKMENPMSKKVRICTMKSTTDFCRIPGQYGYKWPSLSELNRKLFRTDFKEAHNATVDIQITAKCFWELRKTGKI